MSEGIHRGEYSDDVTCVSEIQFQCVCPREVMTSRGGCRVPSRRVSGYVVVLRRVVQRCGGVCEGMCRGSLNAGIGGTHEDVWRLEGVR